MGDAANLRVLHVITSMAAEAGGPPAVCAGLAGALAARGHKVTIAALSETGRTPVPVATQVQTVFFPPDSNGRYGASSAMSHWLRGNVAAFDIVHLHSLWQFPTFAAARACWHRKVPYVVLLNGMLDRYSVAQRSYWIKRLYWLLREGRIEGRARGIHCLNGAEIRRAVPWIRTLPKFIIGNGIAATELAAMPPRGRFRAKHPEFADAPLALFLSRLHPKKGLDRLIPAWKEFVQRVPQGRLLIAGTGDAAYVAALDRLIKSSGMLENIIRVGQLVGPDKWEALVDADLFVLPSHQEGFSMAITEALAAGCVPVVTEECNFDELRQHDCGLIIQNGDMPALARAAAELLVDASRRRKLAEAGQRLVRERCTWERIAEQMEAVYQWIRAGRALPPSGEAVWAHLSAATS